MPHGLFFADLMGVLALSHGRMIVRDFMDFSVANLVQPRIAHMPDHGRTVIEHRHREHARHSFPFGIAARRTQNFVVGHGNGLAHALLGGAGLPFQTRAHPPDSNFGGLLAGRLPADTVDHEENAALRIHVQRVFIISPHEPRIASPGKPQLGISGQALPSLGLGIHRRDAETLRRTTSPQRYGGTGKKTAVAHDT